MVHTNVPLVGHRCCRMMSCLAMSCSDSEGMGTVAS